MKKIILTQGKTAFIDDNDFELISQYKWNANKIGLKFYAKVCSKINGKWRTVYMHVLIMGKKHGFEIDHINHDGLDNRRVNLRHVTRSQNCCNNRHRENTTSIYKGVSWHKKNRGWCARLHKNGIKYYLGIHSSQELAAKEYNRKAIEIFGEFANVNIIKK